MFDIVEFVARMERSEIRDSWRGGTALHRAVPVIGPRFARTRWLHAGYAPGGILAKRIHVAEMSHPVRRATEARPQRVRGPVIPCYLQGRVVLRTY